MASPQPRLGTAFCQNWAVLRHQPGRCALLAALWLTGCYLCETLPSVLIPRDQWGISANLSFLSWRPASVATSVVPFAWDLLFLHLLVAFYRATHGLPLERETQVGEPPSPDSG